MPLRSWPAHRCSDGPVIVAVMTLGHTLAPSTSMVNDLPHASRGRACYFRHMKPVAQSPDETAALAPAEACDRRPRLNVKLHQRLMLEGGARPSTFASAMEALYRIRRQREAEARSDGQ